MRRFSPFVLAACLVAGCQQPTQRTSIVTPRDTRALAYDQFVAQRTEELMKMRGPFTDRADAAEKARAQADARYGTPDPEYATSWTWRGTSAEEQDALETELTQMKREATR